jgi:hypothetical protein
METVREGLPCNAKTPPPHAKMMYALVLCKGGEVVTLSQCPLPNLTSSQAGLSEKVSVWWNTHIHTHTHTIHARTRARAHTHTHTHSHTHDTRTHTRYTHAQERTHTTHTHRDRQTHTQTTHTQNTQYLCHSSCSLIRPWLSSSSFSVAC